MRRRAVWCLALAAIVPAQGAVTFQFSYSDAAGTGFNDATDGAARQGALQSAASILSGYLSDYSATLQITVSSTLVNNNNLASAGSPTSSAAGFNRTVVQQKILGGNDLNGGSADGSASFNFFHSWSYGDVVAPGTYDFKGVAMHEMMHALGFFSFVKATGQGGTSKTSGTPDTWSIFDDMLVTSDGTPLVTADFRYDTTVGLAPLTGNPGVFFAGANAVSAFGGVVPIYTPSVFASGSSMSHVNGLVIEGESLMMNPSVTTGLAARSLSTVEVGILKDIGYTMVPELGTWGVWSALGLLAYAAGRGRVARG